MFRKALDDKSLLPPSLTHGLANDEILSIAVVSKPYNASLFVQGWNCNCKDGKPAVLRGTYADDSLPPGFGRLFVRADVKPAIANQLIIGGLPSSRLGYLVGLLLLSCALAVVAVMQLRRANDLARLRAEFVASVSHELRTPLAQIRLFLETLRLGRAGSEQQRDWALGNIERETSRLSHLVENVLHFAGSDRRSSAQLPEPHVMDVGAELQQIIDAFEPLAASRRANITATIPTGIHAPLRRDAFRQVILNLLDNAIKYGPKGQTVRVSLSQEIDKGDGAFARITVADEGPGVPPAEREAVWKPFYRGSSTAVRAVGGSGIGLPIVREIVAQHGGRAWIEATPAGGATFIVELPAITVSDGQRDRAADEFAGRTA
jgi:signal transduction histidine kinase